MRGLPSRQGLLWRYFSRASERDWDRSDNRIGDAGGKPRRCNLDDDDDDNDDLSLFAALAKMRLRDPRGEIRRNCTRRAQFVIQIRNAVRAQHAGILRSLRATCKI